MAQRSLQLSLTQQQQNKRARYGASSAERGPLEGKPKSPSMCWLGRVKDGNGEWVSYYDGKSVELFKKKGGQENKEYGKGTFTHLNFPAIFQKGGKKGFLPVASYRARYFRTANYDSPYCTARFLWEGQVWVGATSLRNLMNCFHAEFPREKGGENSLKQESKDSQSPSICCACELLCCLQLYQAHQHWPCLATFT